MRFNPRRHSEPAITDAVKSPLAYGLVHLMFCIPSTQKLEPGNNSEVIVKK